MNVSDAIHFLTYRVNFVSRMSLKMPTPLQITPQMVKIPKTPTKKPNPQPKKPQKIYLKMPIPTKKVTEMTKRT